MELTITDAATGTRVDGLRPTVVPWMPAMGHGTSVAPTVTEKGAGRYLVTGVSFFMPGRWELRTTFPGKANDSAVPVFDVP